MKKYLTTIVVSLFFALVITPSKTMAALELTSKEDIIAFQKSKGLKADGIIGPKTRAALKAENEQVNPKKQKKKTSSNVLPKDPCHFLVWEVECSSGSRTSFDDKIPNDSAFLPKHMEEAKSQIGLNARTDRQKLKTELSQANKQIVDPVTVPWCAAWANKVLADAGIQGTDSLMARSFLVWGKEVTGIPHIGDVVVMRRGRNRYAGHVGFFYGFVDDANGVKKVAVLGGNQGKEVKISYYPISRVIAYRTT